MKDNIIDWVKSCTDELIQNFSKNEEALTLIESFVTQYEINTLRILDKNSDVRSEIKIQYFRQKLKNKFRLKKKALKEYLKSDLKQVDLLFWPFQKMHLDVQIEIYRKLHEEETLNLAIFSHNKPVDQLLQQEKLANTINYNSIEPFWEDYKELNFYKELMISTQNLPALHFNEKTVYFQDVLLSSLNSWFWLYVKTRNIFAAILKLHQPKAIFVGNSVSLAGNIISHLAYKKGIKIFCLMHGRLSDYVKFSKFHFFYLFGEYDKISLINEGIPISKLIVSGSPKIDHYLNSRKQKSKNKSETILIALSGPGHSITQTHHVEILSILYQVAIEYPRAMFNFKLHKKDKLNYYNELDSLPNTLISEYGDPTVSSNIYDWIAEADMLITGSSTSALDAMVMNCPVITIDLLNHLSNVDFIKEKISLHATNYDELALTIGEVFIQGEKLQNHLNLASQFIRDLYSQPKMGSINFIKEHLKSVVE